MQEIETIRELCAEILDEIAVLEVLLNEKTVLQSDSNSH